MIIIIVIQEIVYFTCCIISIIEGIDVDCVLNFCSSYPVIQGFSFNWKASNKTFFFLNFNSLHFPALTFLCVHQKAVL